MMKRIWSFALALILALGLLPTAALAADSYALGTSASMEATAFDLQTVRPDTSYLLNIHKNGQPVTRQDVRGDKLDVKVKASKGSQVVDNISIAYDGDIAYVKVEFVKLHLSIKEVDFEMQVYLTKNKSRLSETNTTLFGTMDNHVQYVDALDQYVNMVDWPLVEAEDYIKRIEADLGSGVSIFARMNSGRRYYGYATRTPGDAEMEYINKYRFDDFYSITTINLNGAGNVVRLDAPDTMHVYNSGLEYIGTAKDDLPYSTRYYLSSEKIDIDAKDVTPGTGTQPDDSDDDDLYDKDGPDADPNGNVGNAGDRNPNTGVSGAVNVAAAMALVSLAVIGVTVSRRKKTSRRFPL